MKPRNHPRWWATLTALALLWAPRVSEACSVCTGGRDDETRLAFILTTVLLSVLPLALVGGFVVWLVRRSRSLERDAAYSEPVVEPLLRTSSSQ